MIILRKTAGILERREFFRKKPFFKRIILLSFFVFTFGLFNIFILRINLLKTSKHPNNFRKEEALKVGEIENQLPLVSPSDYSKGYVYYAASDGIYKVDEKTKNITRIKEGLNIQNLSLSKEKKLLFYLEDGVIWKTDLAGKTKVKLTDEKSLIKSFLLSPDGNTIAFAEVESYFKLAGSEKADEPVTHPYLIAINGTGRKRINYPPKEAEPSMDEVWWEYSYKGEGIYTNVSAEKWSPDSTYLILRGSGFLEASNNFWEVEPSKNIVKKFVRYGEYELHHMPEIFYLPTSYKLMWIDDEGQIWIADPDGANKTVKYITGYRFSGGMWSPDEEKIAIHTLTDKHHKLQVMKGSEEIFSTLTNEGGEDYYLAGWTTDSRFLVATHKYHFSPDKKIKHDEIIIIDTHSGKKYTYSMKDMGYEPNQIGLYIIKITESGRIYYTAHPENKYYTMFSPQLRFIDIASGVDTKIAETEFRLFDMFWTELDE